MIFNRFRKKTGAVAKESGYSTRKAFEKLLTDMGFLPEDIHYAHTSLHEGFPEKAWYFPRPDDRRESLALIAIYDDGTVVLREYPGDGSKPEVSYSLGSLEGDFDNHNSAMAIEESISRQKLNIGERRK